MKSTSIGNSFFFRAHHCLRPRESSEWRRRNPKFSGGFCRQQKQRTSRSVGHVTGMVTVQYKQESGRFARATNTKSRRYYIQRKLWWAAVEGDSKFGLTTPGHLFTRPSYTYAAYCVYVIYCSHIICIYAHVHDRIVLILISANIRVGTVD